MKIIFEKKRKILGILLFIFMLNFVFAASILDELHLNIQTTDAGGNVVTGTFDFDFNISTTSDCNNVIYSDSATLTTDSRGIISYYLTGVNMDYANQYYLCYYRDDVLINNSKISRSPYAFRAKYVNTSGIEVDSNLDLSGFNFTSDYIFGDGSGLSNLNVSNIDLSDYVPYTGADKNLVLGDNNFSVGGSDFFVDADSGNVGIGTVSSDYPLEVVGNTSLTSDYIARIFDQGTGYSRPVFQLETLGSAARMQFKTPSHYWNWYLGAGGEMRFDSDSGTSKLSIESNSKQYSLYANSVGTGIGTNSVNNALTVNGSADFSGNVGINTTTPQNKLNVIGDINATGYIIGDGSQLTNLNVSNIDLSDYVPYTGANQNLVLGDNNFSVGGSDLFVNSNTGFVGIGTDVQPDSKTFFSVYQPSSNSNIRIATGSSGASASIQLLSDDNHWEFLTQKNYQGGNLIIRPSSSGNPEMFNFVNTGRFGIGTSTPQNELNVIGDINATGLIYGNGSQLTGISAGLWSENAADIYYNDGNVGIGTTTPQNTLNVVGDINVTSSEVSMFFEGTALVIEG